VNNIVNKIVARKLLDLPDADSEKVFGELDDNYKRLKDFSKKLSELLEKVGEDEQVRLDAIDLTNNIETVSLELVKVLKRLPNSMEKIKIILS